MIDMLRDNPLFSKLSDHQLHSIADECTLNSYSAGTILFRENDTGTVFYLIVSGAIKIYTSNNHGEDIILSISSKGDSFGELSLFDGKPRSATAQTIEDTTLISLTSKNFDKLMRNNYDLTLSIIKQLSIRLRETNRQVHDLTYLNAKQRILKKLVSLANKHGKRQGSSFIIKINLNYDEVAQFAGVSKALLFEAFSELQSKNILKVRGNEFILDLTMLK